MLLVGEWAFFPCNLNIDLTFAIFNLLKFTEHISRQEPSLDDSIVREDFGGNKKDFCFPGAVVLT